jgi:type VI protein secretion system component Hcp
VATNLFLVLTNAQGALVKGESAGQVNDPWIGSIGTGTTVQNPIELQSAHLFGASSTTLSSTAASGASAGRLSMNPVELAMESSVVSPALFLACASNTAFNFADILVTKSAAAGQQTTFLSYRLSKASTVGYDDSATSGDVPITRIQLLFTQLQIGYRQTNPDGTLGPFVRTGWDFTRNTPL